MSLSDSPNEIELSNLVVIDATCESYTDALNQYIMQGYELKLTNKGLFYLTKWNEIENARREASKGNTLISYTEYQPQ